VVPAERRGQTEYLPSAEDRDRTQIGLKLREQRASSACIVHTLRRLRSLTALSVVVFLLENTMAATKFAISVPSKTMAEVDRAAKRLGLTRSGYVAEVLARIAKRERDASISKRIDRVLEELDEQDLATARHLRAARRNEGTEW
jgi:hypothetical protein